MKYKCSIRCSDSSTSSTRSTYRTLVLCDRMFWQPGEDVSVTKPAKVQTFRFWFSKVSKRVGSGKIRQKIRWILKSLTEVLLLHNTRVIWVLQNNPEPFFLFVCVFAIKCLKSSEQLPVDHLTERSFIKETRPVILLTNQQTDQNQHTDQYLLHRRTIHRDYM